MRWVNGLIVVAVLMVPAQCAEAQAYVRRRVASQYDVTGQNSLISAQAAIYYQQAERMAIENHVARVQAYFEGRRMNREYLQAERGPRATSEDLARYAREETPRRLNSLELDPESGRIFWPRVLKTDTYFDDRTDLDRLFTLKAKSDDGLEENDYEQAVHAGHAMRDELRNHIRQLVPTDYLYARNFLTKLVLEARTVKE